MKFLLRSWYNIWGKIILFPICYKAIGDLYLPDKYYFYDNEEDGFTGNKRKIFGPNKDTGWYDNYLGFKVGELSKLKQAWYAYKWSAMRNPQWNLRYHPKVSISINDHTKMEIKGNTRKHDWGPGKQWYDVVTNGKYKSHFRLLPLTKKYSLYLRWGWKIYPEFYGKPRPPYKDRSIPAISIRIRGKQ